MDSSLEDMSYRDTSSMDSLIDDESEASSNTEIEGSSTDEESERQASVKQHKISSRKSRNSTNESPNQSGTDEESEGEASVKQHKNISRKSCNSTNESLNQSGTDEESEGEASFKQQKNSSRKLRRSSNQFLNQSDNSKLGNNSNSDNVVSSDNESLDGNSKQITRASTSDVIEESFMEVHKTESFSENESIIRPKLATKKAFIDSDSEDDYYTPTTNVSESVNELSTLLDVSHLVDDSSSVQGEHSTDLGRARKSVVAKEKSLGNIELSANESGLKRRDSLDNTDIESVASTSSNVIEIISDSEDENQIQQSVIDPKFKQPTLQQVLNKVKTEPDDFLEKAGPANKVSADELQCQKEIVAKLQFDVQKTKNMLNTVNLPALPDKGNLLKQRYESLVYKLSGEEEKLKIMLQTAQDAPPVQTAPKPLTWMEIESGSAAVQPKTFGKRALATHNLEKALTMERLETLHGSLKSCPTEESVAEDPRGLKITLMPHQRQALAWLMWREKQKPKGGILADDMGLGKTLTMISLMMKTNEIEKDEENDVSDEEEDKENEGRYKFTGGTLVVCPASLIQQWEGEVKNRTKRGLISVELYHGPNREYKAKRLCKYDMVITTYAIVMNELEKNTPLFKIKWKRIILDEAHQIRNHKSRTAIAAFQLSAHTRWVLTGTPIHNKEVDLYSLLKFLRCSPFDDLTVFKRWATEKNAGGSERLNTVMSSLMLRRTKSQLQIKGSLQCLPERQWEIIEIHMDKAEMDVYQKVLIFSRTLFSQYLHQRAEKNQDRMGFNNTPIYETNTKYDANNQYSKMHQRLIRLNKVKEVKQHQILLLLLRLRQICCHPSLITAMLEDGDIGAADDEMYDQEGELNILDQLNKLQLEDKEPHNESTVAQGAANEGVDLSEATKGVLHASQPIFNSERLSTKMSVAIKLLKEKILPKGDKGIIVSQWANFLRLFAIQLRHEGIEYLQLDGSIPVNKRGPIIDALNDSTNKIKVLLLSLTAGGVGLNLVGANHLVLLDLHWNPQLEMQAQDRIYRVGQKKPVNVYKLMVTDSIEERIKFLQDRKKDIAESVLTGAKISQQSKLTLNDLKMLFEV